MRIIRASEVNSYLFCRRSWMYRLQGIQPGNQQELQSGTDMHYHHGRTVVTSRLTALFAFIFFIAAIVTTIAIWLR